MLKVLSQASAQKSNKQNKGQYKEVKVSNFVIFFSTSQCDCNTNDKHPEISKIKYLIQYHFEQMAQKSKQQQENNNQHSERSSVGFHSKLRKNYETIGQYLQFGIGRTR